MSTKIVVNYVILGNYLKSLKISKDPIVSFYALHCVQFHYTRGINIKYY